MATLKGMGGVLALCLIFTLGVYWWLAIPCSADPACAVSVAAYPQRYHAFVAVGLGVVLLRESFLLLISCAEKAANAEKAPRQLQDMAARDLLAQGLLSLLLLSLSTAETYLAWTSVPWVHSTSLGGVVYSVRYLEWLVNVPLLMLLTCCGALGRPISDATGPILATNAYILISWAALFLETAALRWLLIAGTFAAYGWASRTMLQWVSSFMEDGIDTPCRRTRAASVVLLIVVFGIYGVIYLAGVSGIIDFATEHLGYTFMGFTCKVTLSILFASIRAYQNHQALSRLVTKLSGLSTAFVSLLRGSFDHVLSCSVDRSGSCFLKANGREVAALSRFLGRSVKEDAGTFNELLCKEEQELFANYVKNALRQSENQMQNATVDLSKDAEPPVAHALQVHLQTRSTPDEQTELVSVMVHLSLVHGPCHKAVLALQLVAQDHPWAFDQKSQTQDRRTAENLDNDSTQPPDDSSTEGPGGNFRQSLSGTTCSDSCGTSSIHKEATEEACVDQVYRKAGKKISRCRRRTAKLLVHFLDRRLRQKKRPGRKDYKDHELHSSCGRDECGKTIASSCSYQKVSFQCGGSDVRSQSSRLSAANSVVVACRQLLGPLHDALPPAQYISRTMEDHMQCSAEMIRLKACNEMTRQWHKQQVEDWKDRADAHHTSVVLQRSQAPAHTMPEQLWRNEVLANLEAPHPGPRPVPPDLLGREELWHKAWKRTYESDSEDEE